ncbi:MAG: ribosome maturation factor RimP [Holosporales bacterium]|jgi:ribosome maturation factor RimP|nr:ribosome maturation factor RimP [Holosporales bacterium]
MSVSDKVESIISESLQARGYEVVRVGVSGRGNPTVEVLIERLDGCATAVSDCALASRVISALLDVENIINSSYKLNVSSPGIERPLTRLEHFVRFAGKCATVEMAFPALNRRKFTGTIVAVKSLRNMPHILMTLKAGQEMVELPFINIKRAKLNTDKV